MDADNANSAFGEAASAAPDKSADSSGSMPEEVEEAAGTLLSALNDCDTVVRWSAAKGIARLAERLPPVQACSTCNNSTCMLVLVHN